MLRTKAILSCALFPLLALQLLAVEVGPVEIISSPNFIHFAPQIQADSQNNVYVVWMAENDDQRLLLVRSLIAGKWQPAYIIFESARLKLTYPCLFVNKNDVPFLCWVVEAEQGDSLFLSYRLDGQWITPVKVCDTPGYNIENPAIAATDEGRIFIAWQEGKGIETTVKVATQDDQGNFSPLTVQPDSRDYNLYPQLFLLPAPIVLWLKARGERVEFCSYAFIPDANNWYPYPLAGVDKLTLKRLPSFFASPDDQLCALWYDQWEGRDRIYYCPLAEEDVAPLIVDQNPNYNNQLPFAQLGKNQEVYLTWVARNEEEGEQIFLNHGIPPEFKEPIMVSDGEPHFYTYPRLTVTPSGKVHLVWFSEHLDGGNGSIYYTYVQF